MGIISSVVLVKTLVHRPRTKGKNSFYPLAFQFDGASKIEDNRFMGINGVVIVNKPAGWTSHDVVGRVRRIAQERSVGHMGTLDPMATGVLPLVLGRMTRLAQFYTATEKVYEGRIQFGVATDTYDAEGEPTSAPIPVGFGLAELEQAAGGFRGGIHQMPPPFSAKKIAGVPAYKLARRKQEVTLREIAVEVHEFDILAFAEGVAHFRARVSSGTYIRAIAHDLGRKLGTGGHLTALRRTQVGEFDIRQAVTLEQLESAAAAGSFEQLLIHPRKLLPEMPSVTADEVQMAKIRHGNPVNLPEFSQAKMVKVFVGQGELVAIASRIAGTLFQPKIVLTD